MRHESTLSIRPGQSAAIFLSLGSVQSQQLTQDRASEARRRGSEEREREEKFVVAVRRNRIGNTGNAITDAAHARCTSELALGGGNNSHIP